MCGIAFVINYGKKDMDVDFLYGLFETLSIRGTDASGYYFERVEDGKMAKRTVKSPQESMDLIEQIKSYESGDELCKYKLTGKENFIMFHCRQGTRGSKYKNVNNMPIFSKNYLLVHNGIITNGKITNYPYRGEVDSEEILARVETSGIIKGLEDCFGSMAIILKPIKQRMIYVYRNTNPLDLVYFKDKEMLIGCSNGSYVVDSIDESNLLDSLQNPSQSIIEFPAHKLYAISLTKLSVKFVAEIGVIKEIKDNNTKWPRANDFEIGQQND